MVSVSGSGLEQVAVNKLASFHVNTKGAGGGDVKVEIKCKYKFGYFILKYFGERKYFQQC